MRIYLLSVVGSGLILLLAGRAPADDAKPAGDPSKDTAALFDQLDANHDGQLTSDEIPAEKQRLFERLLRRAGKPADGKLSRDEFIAQLKSNDSTSGPALAPPATTDKPATKPPADVPAPKPGATTPNPAGPLANRPQVDPERMFARLSKDGKLTLDDVPEQRRPLLRRVFAEAGKADGGALTKEEFVKAFKAVAAKRPALAGLGPLARPAGDSKAATDTKSTDAKSNGDAKSISDTKPAGDAKPSDKPAGDVPPPGNPAQRLKRLLAMSKRSDGKLTKDDLPQRLQDRFVKIDANHDGLIDEQELKDWIAKAGARLQPPKP